MREIREITEADLEAVTQITAAAYPGVNIVTAEDKERTTQRLKERMARPDIQMYGLFEQEALWGVMRFHDFTMNFLSTDLLIGGLGGVAVDLLHKKEKVARDMIIYFLHHYKQRGVCLTALYPFRPDFYKQMGYGYGVPLNQYVFDPLALPDGRYKSHLTYLTAADTAAVAACYQRFVARTHGTFARLEADWQDLWQNGRRRVVGYKQGDTLLGYLIFSFKAGPHGHFLHNDLVVHEWVYENTAVFAELCTFLRTQADQIDRVIFATQDDRFYHVLRDPRNRSGQVMGLFHESNVQGVGLMYRVIDVPGFFRILADHNFGGQSCRLKLTLTDSFFPENAGSTLIHFEEGRAQLPASDAYQVEVMMDVAEFSSMVMGVIEFDALYQYGLAHISDAVHVPVVNALFKTGQRPVCLTQF